MIRPPYKDRPLSEAERLVGCHEHRNARKPFDRVRVRRIMMISIGHKNFIENDYIVEILKTSDTRAAIITHTTAGSGMLINATEGKRIRSMITLNTGHVVLSAVASKTLESRRTKNADSSFGDRRVAAYPALNQDINYSKPHDPVDGRREPDRRRFSYSAYIPERRNGVERRSGTQR